ncbi:DUF1513 domain-containing protein [Marinomonas sp. C2222]|uniref:DUF1513 domain-containing protein n=1 Tax=Marinomonas sargassi TaxID=2984494 RepID=A0ABT2YRX0_9GAMM|nr:DUF1513 domain-containing protein [Marinomonas sargassi]MCV2402621.1 DUF1513 domain-containing protein [Marinomonas sargassi]
MLTRRSFLALGSALTLTPTWAEISGAGTNRKLYASAFSTPEKKHYFGVIDDNGSILWKNTLPARAHAPVIHPEKAIIGIVSRRPGYFMHFYNLADAQLIKRIEPQKGHHFYGHATFSDDGKNLITQENHYPSGAGKIFIRQWPSGEIIHEYSSNGIGPHESILWQGNTLAIANGGLKTHPNNDREILNRETMEPNLTYLSLENGQPLNKLTHPKEYSQLSIRHLDINRDGIAALGFQYKGDLRDQVPLVALSHISWSDIKYLSMPEDVRIRFKQYCGSVCFDKSGNILAISTPRGGLVAFWDVNSKTYLGLKNCRDVCGIAPTDSSHEFLLSSGTGTLMRYNPIVGSTTMIKKHTNILWDNHLKCLSV